MKKLLIAALFLFLVSTPVFAQVASDVEGKWTMKQKTDEGETVNTLEIKGSTFTYRIADKDGSLRFFAKGKAKTDKVGKLNTITFSAIEWGTSESGLETSGDDRVDVYTVRYGQLMIASNYDKERDNEEPKTEVFTKSR